MSKLGRTYTHNNKTMPLSEWSKETGISIATLQYRIANGWGIEDAISRPVGNNRGRMLEHNGQTKSVVEWSRVIGIPASTIIGRLVQGYPVEQALSSETCATPGRVMTKRRLEAIKRTEVEANPVKVAPSQAGNLALTSLDMDLKDVAALVVWASDRGIRFKLTVDTLDA